jgi:hypothetical protein
MSVQCVPAKAGNTDFTRGKSKYQVIHYPQLHWRDEIESNPKQVEAVAMSQFDLAHFILDHPELAVFVEGVAEDWTPQTLVENTKSTQLCEQIFPSGIPLEFNRLTPLQKLFIAREGAPQILFLMGKLPYIHRTIEPSDEDLIQSAIEQWSQKNGILSEEALNNDPTIVSLIMHERERFAIRQIQSFLHQRSDRQNTLLVYGGAHDFLHYISPKLFHRHDLPACVVSFITKQLSGE